MSSAEITLAIGIGIFSGALTLSGITKVKTLFKLLGLVRQNKYMPIEEIQKQRDVLSSKELFFVSGTLQHTKFYSGFQKKDEWTLLEGTVSYDLFSSYQIDKRNPIYKLSTQSAVEIEDHEVPTQRLKLAIMTHSNIIDLSMVTKESPVMLTLSRGRRFINFVKNGIAGALTLLTGMSFRGSIIGTSEHTLTLLVGTPIFAIAKIEPKNVSLLPMISIVGPITSSLTQLQNHIESKILINSFSIAMGLAGIVFSFSIIANKILLNFSHKKVAYTQESLRRRKTKEFEEAPENLRCIVCLDQLKNYLFFPCNHCSMCVTCGDKFYKQQRNRRCPICKISVEEELLIKYV